MWLIKCLYYFLLILIVSCNAYADRKELTLNELQALFPDAVIGMSTTSNVKGCYSVLVFRSNFNLEGKNTIKVCGAGMSAKPTEHFEAETLYLFYTKVQNGKRILGRILKISNLMISSETLKQKSVKNLGPINALEQIDIK